MPDLPSHEEIVAMATELAEFRALFADPTICPGETPLERAREFRKAIQEFATTGFAPKWSRTFTETPK